MKTLISRIHLILPALLILTILPTSEVQAQQLPPTATPAAEQTAPHPRLEVKGNLHDFGDISPGTTVSHSFLVINKGQSPLNILAVQSGCGCSTTHFDPQIAPGASGSITLTMKTYPEWAGQEIRKSTWVLTNDPLAPQFRLILAGKVTGTEPLISAGDSTAEPQADSPNVPQIPNNSNSPQSPAP